MFILTLNDLERCGVKRLSSQLLPGFKFQRWPFYVQKTFPQGEEVLRLFRNLLDSPQAPTQILLVDSDRYHLLVHEVDLECFPYTDVIRQVLTQMQTDPNLVKDRRWGLRIFEQCFVGSEAVTWMVERLYISREEALKLCQQCVKLGFFAHVLGEQDFADQPYFYRFAEDGLPEDRIFKLPRLLGLR